MGRSGGPEGTGFFAGAVGVSGLVGAWERQARRVAEVCAARLPVLIGVYAHGSAALGGFTRASDLDVLVIGMQAADWPALGRELLSTAIDFPLELSVVAPPDAARPAAPWPFLLHVASPDRIVRPHLGGGDPDLCAHYAVTRQAGIPILGPPAEEVFGQVSRGMMLTYLRGELVWGVEHADQRYAILNACRAAAYATDQVILSKIDGGRWWARRYGHDRLVQQALAAQAAGYDLGPCTPDAAQFIQRAARTVTHL